MKEKGEKIKEKKSRLKQGCMQLSNFINIKNRRIFMNKFKQKNEALLIIYKSLIWFEKLYTKIKLKFNKRFFLKILKVNKTKRKKKKVLKPKMEIKVKKKN
jgi:hypothetical protein